MFLCEITSKPRQVCGTLRLVVTTTSSPSLLLVHHIEGRSEVSNRLIRQFVGDDPPSWSSTMSSRIRCRYFCFIIFYKKSRQKC